MSLRRPAYPSPLLWGDAAALSEVHRPRFGATDLYALRNKATDGTTSITAEYLEVVARKT